MTGAGGEILSVPRTFFIVLLFLSTIALSSCDRVDQTVTAYLDGCRDKQGFLLRESLEKTNDDPVILDLIEFRVPRGYYSRLGYEVIIGDRPWRAQFELWGNLVPSVRTAFLTTSIGTKTVAVSFVAEVGVQADASSLVTVIRSIQQRPNRY
jgi:hypothetical protein